ncbi:hypothetical protein DT603_09255 [Pseudoxanthomonas gei]|uniref:Uncharacterized protein n=1 Tax=Pseudoxanthomonas gei TaxID=1383030 RepID=A0ABX0AHN1_9GAMM|nr:hypothetical protein [Pseudoxanthomonas gei]
MNVDPLSGLIALRTKGLSILNRVTDTDTDWTHVANPGNYLATFPIKYVDPTSRIVPEADVSSQRGRHIHVARSGPALRNARIFQDEILLQQHLIWRQAERVAWRPGLNFLHFPTDKRLRPVYLPANNHPVC